MGNKFRFNYELREIQHDFNMKFKEIITLTEFGIFFFSKQQKKKTFYFDTYCVTLNDESWLKVCGVVWIKHWSENTDFKWMINSDLWKCLIATKSFWML